MMPTWILSLLLRYVAPMLAELVVAFVANLKRARADDPRLLEVVELIVSGIDRDQPTWPGSQKREYAADAIKRYAIGIGKDLSSSLVNTLIELVVQRRKAEHVPPDSARTIGIDRGLV